MIIGLIFESKYHTLRIDARGKGK